MAPGRAQSGYRALRTEVARVRSGPARDPPAGYAGPLRVLDSSQVQHFSSEPFKFNLSVTVPLPGAVHGRRLEASKPGRPSCGPRASPVTSPRGSAAGHNLRRSSSVMGTTAAPISNHRGDSPFLPGMTRIASEHCKWRHPGRHGTGASESRVTDDDSHSGCDEFLEPLAAAPRTRVGLGLGPGPP